MTVGNYTFGLGTLIALLVLIAVFVLWLSGHAATDDVVYALIGALAVSRLVP